MGAQIVILENRFPAIAARIVEASQQILRDGAQVVYDEAVTTSPVRTGALQLSHIIEVEGDARTVRATGGDKGRQYAAYVDRGTIHMAAQPWFTRASEVGAAAIEAMGGGFEGMIGG